MSGWTRDELREARLAGYEHAARQFREGKQIARPLNTWGRAAFMGVVLLAVAAVAMTAAWVVR